jgi:putative glutamine amidotransferase
MKKILISMRVTESESYHEVRNSIAFEYINFFESLGYLVILIPNNSSNIDKYIDNNVIMIVLSGGNNVSPTLYNSNEKLLDVYSERDACEQKLTEISLQKNIKLLGICRGFQFLNVYFGGCLVHNIHNHISCDHSLISSLPYLNEQTSNSYHGQGISTSCLSEDLTTLAKSEDGYIEAFKHKSKSILGVQWHPERQQKSYDLELIQNFIKG